MKEHKAPMGFIMVNTKKFTFCVRVNEIACVSTEHGVVDPDFGNTHVSMTNGDTYTIPSDFDDFLVTIDEAQKQDNFRQRLEEIKIKVKNKVEEKRRNRKPADPEPRYDEVFYEGLKWLDKL